MDPNLPQPEIPPEKPKRLIYILVGLAVIVAAGLIVAVFLKRVPEEKVAADVQLTISAPNQSVSGSELAFEFVIENVSGTRLMDLDLEIFYPDSFEFIDSAPDPGQDEEPRGRRYTFEPLNPGERHKLVVVGVLSGSVQEVKSLSARLRYIPENFRSVFELEKRVSTVMLAPNLAVKIIGPARVFAGQAADYEITVSNESDRDFRDITLDFLLPDGFLPEEDEPEFILEGFRSRDTKTFRLTGQFSETARGEAVIRTRLYLGRGEERNLAGQSFVFTDIAEVPLRLSHSISIIRRGFQEQMGDFFTEGSRAEITVTYENTGRVGLRNVMVSLDFSGEVFDLSRFANRAGTGQRSGDSIRWIPPAVSELSAVSPGQRGQFTIIVPVSETLARRRVENPRSETEVSFTSEEFTRKVAGNRIEKKVITALQVEADLTFLSGTDDSDRYRIKLTAVNTVSETTNTLLTALVPGINARVSSFSSDDLSFDSASGLLRWELGNMPAFSAREVSFELETSSNELLKDIFISGRDAFAGSEVSSEQQTLTAR